MSAHLIEIEYLRETPLVDDQRANYQEAILGSWLSMVGQEIKFQTGQWDLANAEITDTKLQATYRTSTQLNAPMEPHAIIAQWHNEESVTVYEPTQWVTGFQRTYAQLFGLATEKVHIISPYLGGGFGSKAFPWPHSILCIAVARQLGQPLKVVVSRRQMTANTGHRSQTEQMIRLVANKEGMLQSVEHEAKSCTSVVDVFTELCTAVTSAMYATPNLSLNQQLATLNIGTPGFMRAPGENPGLWALESAMDELAWALQIDPVVLRLKNETKKHQRKGLPFSAKHFADCLDVGAKRFGWSNRAAQPRSQRQGDKLIGWGMAGSTYPGSRGKSSAKVRLLADGTAHVLTSGNDMGTGSYTVLAVIAAEALGISVEQVRVEMGDSLLPDGWRAGGSQMTASLTPAVQLACQEVLKVAGVRQRLMRLLRLFVSQDKQLLKQPPLVPLEQKPKNGLSNLGEHTFVKSV